MVNNYKCENQVMNSDISWSSLVIEWMHIGMFVKESPLQNGGNYRF